MKINLMLFSLFFINSFTLTSERSIDLKTLRRSIQLHTVHMHHLSFFDAKDINFKELSQDNSDLEKDLRELYRYFQTSDLSAKLDEFCSKWSIEKISLKYYPMF